MPKGPRDEKRPADVIGGAVKVMRIATGEELDDREDAPVLAQQRSLGSWVERPGREEFDQRRSGREIARKAAEKRWSR